MWCPLPLPGESIFRNQTFSKALDVVSLAPAGGTHFQKSDFYKSPGCGVHCACRRNPFSEIALCGSNYSVVVCVGEKDMKYTGKSYEIVGITMPTGLGIAILKKVRFLKMGSPGRGNGHHIEGF